MSFFDPHCCFCKRRYFSSTRIFSNSRLKNLSEIDKINFILGNQHCVRCSSSFKDRQHQLDCFATAPKFYHLNIDTDLLPRFMKMIDVLQKYSLAFFSEKIENLIELKPLMVAQNMVLDNGNFYIPNFDSDKNTVVIGNFEMSNILLRAVLTKTLYDKFTTLISTRKLIINAENIVLSKIQISTNAFFQILSSRTTTIKCSNVEFTTSLTFSDFIQRVADLEEFTFENTNIQFDEYWTETLFNHSKSLNIFCVPLKSLNLSANSSAISASAEDETKFFLDLEKIDKELAQKFSKFSIEVKEDNLYASKIVNF